MQHYPSPAAAVRVEVSLVTLLWIIELLVSTPVTNLQVQQELILK
jgi:hypothetical protein